MSKIFSYTTSGVCSKKINIEIENDTIVNVKFEGGCQGNLSGISRLVKGKKIDEIAELLSGVDCSGRGTSCPDQLSIALKSLPI
ncbi:MAG: TIGR03905 family TSCPD domain-containing protein [Rikenellaceae bacterium]